MPLWISLSDCVFADYRQTWSGRVHKFSELGCSFKILAILFMQPKSSTILINMPTKCCDAQPLVKCES